MASHKFFAASAATDRRVGANESFLLHSGFLMPWDADLDEHARQFAELLHQRQMSQPMTIAAMRGVAGMLSTDWWMNQGQSSEAAEARAGEWRRHVVNHIWGVLAEAERLPDRGDRVAQPADQE